MRYPVSKTGGPRGLGGSTPSPSVFVPAWSSGYDARLLIAKGRFEPCRRSSICLLVVGEPVPRRLREPETAGSTPAGQTSASLATRPAARWRRGCPREPHELETWVRIPPAQLATTLGGVAQTRRALACQARVRRFESGRPRSWWPWCRGSIRECETRGAGSSPAGHPFDLRTLSTGELPPAVNRVPRAVVVRLHPSAHVRGNHHRQRKGGAL